MKRLFLLLTLSVCAAFAAIPAATVWELRSATGSDTNGGGYAGGGTDMSQYDNKNATGCSNCQSAASNLSTTALATNASSTGSPFPVDCASCNFTSGVTGNIVYITGGSPAVTAGWYQATYVSSTQINLDRSPGTTTTTGGTINIGGALQTFAITNGTVVAGNTLYATGTFTAAITQGTGGTASAPITVNGYSGTRGSGGAILDGTTSLAYLITSAGVDYWHWNNWTFKGGTTAVINTGAGASKFYVLRNCIFDGTTGGTNTPTIVAGTGGIGSWRIIDFEIKNYAMTAAGLLKHGTAGSILEQGHIHDNTGNQYLISFGTAIGMVFRRVVIHDNSAGNASNGVFNISTTSAADFILDHVTIDNNNGVGINIASGAFRQYITNNLITRQVGAPVACGSSSNNVPNGTLLIGNRYWSNGSSNATTNCYDGGSNAVFGGDPYTGAGNYTLTASYRATSYGTAWLGLGGTTAGALDVGAVQHVETGSGGGAHAYPFVGSLRPPDLDSGSDWKTSGGLAAGLLLGLITFARKV